MSAQTALKKFPPLGRNHSNSLPGEPINGRSSQPICVPTNANTIIQMRKTVLTCLPSTCPSSRSSAPGGGGVGEIEASSESGSSLGKTSGGFGIGIGGGGLSRIDNR